MTSRSGASPPPRSGEGAGPGRRPLHRPFQLLKFLKIQYLVLSETIGCWILYVTQIRPDKFGAQPAWWATWQPSHPRLPWRLPISYFVPCPATARSGFSNASSCHSRLSIFLILCARSPWCCAIGSFRRSIATLRRGCSEPSRASPASSSAPLTRPIFSTWSLSQLSSTRPRFSMPYSFSCSIETCLLLPSLSACHAPASATGQMTGAPSSQSAPIRAKAFQ